MKTDKLIVIYGPSGSGQDSVIEGIAKRLPIERVITSTTRPMRKGEAQQQPYWFLSRQTFQDGIVNDSFIEWAKTYNDELYGVTRDELQRVIATGKIGIWKVDWKGARSVRSNFPEIPVLFISAPIESIRQRISKRDNPTESYIKERMEYIEDLLNRSDLIYDYKIENVDGKLESAIDQATEIIKNQFGQKNS